MRDRAACERDEPDDSDHVDRIDRRSTDNDARHRESDDDERQCQKRGGRQIRELDEHHDDRESEHETERKRTLSLGDDSTRRES